MKTLCLFRHAKSTWGALGTNDIERELHPIGETNAPMMGAYLKDQNSQPDLIITSNAKRAYLTAQLIAEPLGYDKEKIVIEDKIYEAGVEELLHIIQTLEAKTKTVVIVGHNPGLTLLANYLADERVNNLPTCGVFCMTFDTDNWEEITTSESKIMFVDAPIQHK